MLLCSKSAKATQFMHAAALHSFSRVQACPCHLSEPEALLHAAGHAAQMSSRTDSLKPVTASKSRASFGAYAVPVVPRHGSSSEASAQSDQGKATSSPRASSAALRSSGRSSSRAALGLRHSANAQLPPLKARSGPEEAAAGEAARAGRQASQAGPRSSTPEAVQAAPQPTAVETAAALEHRSLQQTSVMDLDLEGADPLVAAADVETPLPGAIVQEQEPEPVRCGGCAPVASELEEPDPAQAAEGKAAPAQTLLQEAEPVLAAADTATPASEARGLQDPEAGLHTAAMVDLQEPGPQPDQAGAAGSEGSTLPGSEPEELQPEESEPEDSDEGDEAGDASRRGGAAPPPSGLMGLIALLEARQAPPPAPAQLADEQLAEGAGPQLARQQGELGSCMDDDDYDDYDEEDEEEHINSLADALLDLWNQTHANESETTSRCGGQLPAVSRLPDWPLHKVSGTSHERHANEAEVASRLTKCLPQPNTPQIGSCLLPGWPLHGCESRWGGPRAAHSDQPEAKNRLRRPCGIECCLIGMRPAGA